MVWLPSLLPPKASQSLQRPTLTFARGNRTSESIQEEDRDFLKPAGRLLSPSAVAAPKSA